MYLNLKTFRLHNEIIPDFQINNLTSWFEFNCLLSSAGIYNSNSDTSKIFEDKSFLSAIMVMWVLKRF